MQINVLEYFELGALTKCRQKVAVVDHDRSYTFDELERLAKNCTALILQRTMAFNQPIAVFLPKSAHTIIADLGILYSGNCYANIDLKSPPERLKAILQNLKALLVITSAAHLAALRSAGVPEDKILLVEMAMTEQAMLSKLTCRAKQGQ
jgi:non-ribosomal peptide synthetase component F